MSGRGKLLHFPSGLDTAVLLGGCHCKKTSTRSITRRPTARLESQKQRSTNPASLLVLQSVVVGVRSTYDALNSHKLNSDVLEKLSCIRNTTVGFPIATIANTLRDSCSDIPTAETLVILIQSRSQHYSRVPNNLEERHAKSVTRLSSGRTGPSKNLEPKIQALISGRGHTQRTKT